MLSSFVGSILFILSATEVCRESILALLSNAQYFRRVDLVQTKGCAVLVGVDTAYSNQ